MHLLLHKTGDWHVFSSFYSGRVDLVLLQEQLNKQTLKPKIWQDFKISEKLVLLVAVNNISFYYFFYFRMETQLCILQLGQG